MNGRTHTWALILAAGEGSRLRPLTASTSGVAVPKQFCSLFGGPSLLQDALLRASHVAPLQRVCAVVAAQHHRWWEGALLALPDKNIIVQPENRGTANGILMPLMHILARDPGASVVVLPADHYLRDEATFSNSLRAAAALAAASPDVIYLLGIEPDEPDTELGYIVPTKRSDYGVSHVSKFVEKPPLKLARALKSQGALWNTFIIAASVRSFIALYEERFAAVAAEMRALAEVDPGTRHGAAAASGLYQRLAPIDFSRDVLEGQEAMLRVLAAPNCGWTDLGTPRRVGQALQQRPAGFQLSSQACSGPSYLNLSTQYARLQSPSATDHGGAPTMQ
jgi:mannose-1-phosphate guanylyltransferase